MGHVDPLKEVNAAAARIQNNITTQEQEASEYNGNDWAANIRQRRKEVEAMKDLFPEQMLQENGYQDGEQNEEEGENDA